MSEHIIHTNNETILRTFDGAALAPPVDLLRASADTRKGTREIDPLAALVRHARAHEHYMAEQGTRELHRKGRAA